MAMSFSITFWRSSFSLSVRKVKSRSSLPPLEAIATKPFGLPVISSKVFCRFYRACAVFQLQIFLKIWRVKVQSDGDTMFLSSSRRSSCSLNLKEVLGQPRRDEGCESDEEPAIGRDGSVLPKTVSFASKSAVWTQSGTTGVESDKENRYERTSVCERPRGNISCQLPPHPTTANHANTQQSSHSSQLQKQCWSNHENSTSNSSKHLESLSCCGCSDRNSMHGSNSVSMPNQCDRRGCLHEGMAARVASQENQGREIVIMNGHKYMKLGLVGRGGSSKVRKYHSICVCVCVCVWLEGPPCS